MSSLAALPRVLADWRPSRTFDFDYTTDKEQPVNSVRYTAWIDERDGLGRICTKRFDIYVPNAVFDDVEVPRRLRVTLQSLP